MNPLAAFLKTSWARYVRWGERQRWERRWRTPDYRPLWLADIPRPFVLSGFEQGWLVPPMRVLEIGCGLGTAAGWLAQRGLRVVAVDFSERVIEQARTAFINQPGLEFRCADVSAPTDILTTFDVILDTGCLQHIPGCLRDGYRQNLLMWSRAGSRFVVTMHKRDYSASERLDEVQGLFSAEFDLVHTEEVRPANASVKHFNSVFHFVRR